MRRPATHRRRSSNGGSRYGTRRHGSPPKLRRCFEPVPAHAVGSVSVRNLPPGSFPGIGVIPEATVLIGKKVSPPSIDLINLIVLPPLVQTMNTVPSRATLISGAPESLMPGIGVPDGGSTPPMFRTFQVAPLT